jgi:hypothetical protein
MRYVFGAVEQYLRHSPSADDGAAASVGLLVRCQMLLAPVGPTSPAAFLTNNEGQVLLNALASCGRIVRDLSPEAEKVFNATLPLVSAGPRTPQGFQDEITLLIGIVRS